jgi:hypothetical protein
LVAVAGGGWTLFASKLTPAFLFIQSDQDWTSLTVGDTDFAGSIPSTTTYNQVLFRFKSSANDRVIYEQQASVGGGGCGGCGRVLC